MRRAFVERRRALRVWRAHKRPDATLCGVRAWTIAIREEEKPMAKKRTIVTKTHRDDKGRKTTTDVKIYDKNGKKTHESKKKRHRDR